MWHVDSYSRYHIIRVVAATTKQVSHKQQGNCDDDDRSKPAEAEAAAAAAAKAASCNKQLWRPERPPHKNQDSNDKRDVRKRL